MQRSYSLPHTCAWSPTFSLIFAAASRARSALRDPMMMDSPARAQRKARPIPAGPVPPSIADRPAQANSGIIACSLVRSSSGALM